MIIKNFILIYKKNRKINRIPYKTIGEAINKRKQLKDLGYKNITIEEDSKEIKL